MRLAGKVAVVTGSARGIGRAIATRYAAEGACCVIADIDQAAAERTAGEIAARDGQGFALHFDVARQSAIDDMVEAVVARAGRIDILVNNAGIIAYEPLDALDLAGWQRVIAVNQTGVFLGMRAAWERSHLIDKCGGRL